VKVGWIGLGKLGLPCAMVLAQHHEVHGYDVSDRPWQVFAGDAEPNQEAGFTELREHLWRDDDALPAISREPSVADVVQQSEIIFIAVQTPHAPEYGGECPSPSPWRDFEYAYLVQACRDICQAALAQQKQVTLAIVSTVVPGTTSRLIQPLLNDYVRLVYTPQFIAMGTTIADFRNPEFVICGTERNDVISIQQMRDVFQPVHESDRLFTCDIVTAESIKAYYNTFISMKIVWANHIMEMCHNTGADCDQVVDALSLATDRIISPRYLRGGMSDGGACHPRDLIALSWLEQRVSVSYPLFSELSDARERQSRWLAMLAKSRSEESKLPVILLGAAYKPESDLADGSPALLVDYYLRDYDIDSHIYDPYCPKYGLPPRWKPAVYVITTKHESWRSLEFPAGSTVIDPFGYIPDRQGVIVTRVGRR
jgi:UDPglucose 6-dehydrogenase